MVPYSTWKLLLMYVWVREVARGEGSHVDYMGIVWGLHGNYMGIRWGLHEDYMGITCRPRGYKEEKCRIEYGQMVYWKFFLVMVF